MNTQTARFSHTQLAVVGLILLLPTLLMELIGSSAFWAPGNGFYRTFDTFISQPSILTIFNAVAPFIFLGGSIIAWIINTWPIVRVNIRKEDGSVVNTIRIQLRPLNIGISVLSLCTLAVLLGYGIAENLPCILGQKGVC